jgi:hypothetical protein
MFIMNKILLSFLLVLPALNCRDGYEKEIITIQNIGAFGSKEHQNIGSASPIIIRNRWTHVENAKELIQALADTTPGKSKTIYIKDNSIIDLTGFKNIVISAGTLLAGGRGINGIKAPLIITHDLNTNPLFRTKGKGIRITGIRFQGPDSMITYCPQLSNEYWSYCDSDNPLLSKCIVVGEGDIEIDNNEIHGWSHAGIEIESSANAYIHHNSIHHTLRWGLGYGVVVDGGYARIEDNIFDWGRHAIAGSPLPTTSYTASFNIIGSHFYHYPIDMHGDLKTGQAGKFIQISNNTVYSRSNTPILVSNASSLTITPSYDELGEIHIEGIPSEGCKIFLNHFKKKNPFYITQRFYNLKSNGEKYKDESIFFSKLDIYDNMDGNDRLVGYQKNLSLIFKK